MNDQFYDYIIFDHFLYQCDENKTSQWYYLLALLDGNSP